MPYHDVISYYILMSCNARLWCNSISCYGIIPYHSISLHVVATFHTMISWCHSIMSFHGVIPWCHSMVSFNDVTLSNAMSSWHLFSLFYFILFHHMISCRVMPWYHAMILWHVMLRHHATTYNDIMPCHEMMS